MVVKEWADCLGALSWLLDPLVNLLHYPHPFPVQQAVIPTVSRALLSGIPMDVSLTAPTGSGKTLCYLIPMLHLITWEKKRNLDDTRLRAIVLVPTKALGQQVYREITRLTRRTTIHVGTLCSEMESLKTEAMTLMRCVRNETISFSKVCEHGASWDMGEDEEEKEMDEHEMPSTHAWAWRGSGSSSECYYSLVDILVATPQRLLRHLDGTTGFSLASLRMLVIDEADQVLVGNFASFVVKVVERFEAEVNYRSSCEEAEETEHAMGCMRQATCGGLAKGNRVPGGLSLWGQCSNSVHTVPTLHKMLCSATLSSRIARISEVRLRNCRYFALDTHGEEIGGRNVADPSQFVKHSVESNALAPGASHVYHEVVRTTFALPPTLQEHIIFVEDHYRHAVLLKLVTTLLERIAQTKRGNFGARTTNGVLSDKSTGKRKRSASSSSLSSSSSSSSSSLLSHKSEETKSAEVRPGGEGNDRDGAERVAGVLAGGAGKRRKAVLAADSAYPTTEDGAGTGIVVFCSSGEEARVMGHFLTSAGIKDILEFTTLATESERRRALLRPSSCVVASDALMRGIDISNIGHVIMYHPPTTLSQYVHRAGRTARAMRHGHLHMLLSKLGPSGTQEDGEVATYKRIGAMCERTLPVRYERHFFMFTVAPSRAQETASRSTALMPCSSMKTSEYEMLMREEALQRKHSTGAHGRVKDDAGTVTKRGPPEGDAPVKMTSLRREATSSSDDAANGTVVGDELDGSHADRPSLAVTGAVYGTAEWWVEQADRFLAASQQQLHYRWSSALDLVEKAKKQAKK